MPRRGFEPPRLKTGNRPSTCSVYQFRHRGVSVVNYSRFATLVNLAYNRGSLLRKGIDMTESYELPLFPLRTVLFPGQMLPLHIFESRYDEMINDCLEGDRTFGVVLIRRGVEVGGPAVPHAVGTTATIQNVSRLPDGRMHITTRGRERFRIQDYHSGSKPYIIAWIVPWPWSDSTPPRAGLTQAVGRFLEQYVGLWSQANNAEINLDQIPRHPTHLALLAAIALQVSLKQKQELLETPSVGELLKRLDQLLRQENRALRVLLAAATRQGEMDGAFSRN